MLSNNQNLPQSFNHASQLAQLTDLEKSCLICQDQGLVSSKYKMRQLFDEKADNELIKDIMSRLELSFESGSATEIAIDLNKCLDDFDFSLSSFDKPEANIFFTSLAICLATQKAGSNGLMSFKSLLSSRYENRQPDLGLTNEELEDLSFELIYALARLKDALKKTDPELANQLRDPIEVIKELGLIEKLTETTDLVALLAWENLLEPLNSTNIFSKANLAELLEDLPQNLAD